MPFVQFVPRRFNANTIKAYAPRSSGVYGLTNAKEWIYIGESGDICASLLSHLAEIGTSLIDRQPTGFIFEECDGANRPARHSRLITEYGPSCNRSASLRTR